MEDMVVKYTATITVGDEYHPVGETYEIFENRVESIKKNGIKLKVKEDGYGVVYYHIYPCYITKTVYKMTPIDVTTFLAGDSNGKIGFDQEDFGDHDWKERWP